MAHVAGVSRCFITRGGGWLVRASSTWQSGDAVAVAGGGCWRGNDRRSTAAAAAARWDKKHRRAPAWWTTSADVLGCETLESVAAVSLTAVSLRCCGCVSDADDFVLPGSPMHPETRPPDFK